MAHRTRAATLTDPGQGREYDHRVQGDTSVFSMGAFYAVTTICLEVGARLGPGRRGGTRLTARCPPGAQAALRLLHGMQRLSVDAVDSILEVGDRHARGLRLRLRRRVRRPGLRRTMPRWGMGSGSLSPLWPPTWTCTMCVVVTRALSPPTNPASHRAPHPPQEEMEMLESYSDRLIQIPTGEGQPIFTKALSAMQEHSATRARRAAGLLGAGGADRLAALDVGQGPARARRASITRFMATGGAVAAAGGEGEATPGTGGGRGRSGTVDSTATEEDVEESVAGV